MFKGGYVMESIFVPHFFVIVGCAAIVTGLIVICFSRQCLRLTKTEEDVCGICDALDVYLNEKEKKFEIRSSFSQAYVHPVSPTVH